MRRSVYTSIFILLAFLICRWAEGAVLDFEVKQTICSPDGYQRPCTLVNHQFPGPLIRVNKNEDITVNLRNSLGTKTTSLHWHGLLQKGSPYMDGSPYASQCPIEPYSTFQYQFNVGEQPGTYWYHSHSGPQYYDGMFGPLIIDDPDDPYKDKYDEDIIVMIQDWAHDSSDTVMAKLEAGVTPIVQYQSLLINGNGRFECASSSGAGQFLNCSSTHQYSNFTVEQGKTYRVRVINTGTKNELIFSIDSHNFTVIEVDGQYTQPQSGESIRVNLGQRYSLLFTADQPIDNYWMRAAFILSYPNDGDPLISDGLAAFRYVGADSSLYPTTTPIPLTEVNVDQLIPLTLTGVATPDHVITINITSIIPDKIYYFNNVTFSPPSVPVYFNMLNDHSQYGTNVITLRQHQVVRLIINNFNLMEHPLHLHGHFFQLLGTGSGVYSANSELNLVNPVVRDTQVFVKQGWAVIQFVADNPGAWFFHCHMEWHMEKGLALIFAELAENHHDLPQLPEDFPLCSNYLPFLSSNDLV